MTKRITDIYIYALLLIFPLWVGFDGYSNITYWKFTFYAVLTVIWAVLLIFFALREREVDRGGVCFAVLAAALLAWCALSAAVSPYSPELIGSRYDGLGVFALYALTACGCALFGRWQRGYAHALGISVALCCAVALLQLAGIDPLRLYPEGMGYYDGGTLYNGRFLGTIGNTNLLGAFLALASPLLAFTAIEKRGRELWLLLPAALGAATAALASSEAALVGLAVAAAAGTIYYVNYYRGRRAAFICLAAEIVLAVAALAWVYIAAPASGTLHELSELLHGRVSGEFGSHRIDIWREALRLFAERPLTGGGPGSFALRSTLEFTRYVPETGNTFHTLADNAHSELLNMLADTGVPGAALWLALCAVAVVNALRYRRAPLALALCASLAQGLFSTGTVFTLPLVCAVAALAAKSGEPGLRSGTCTSRAR